MPSSKKKPSKSQSRHSNSDHSSSIPSSPHPSTPAAIAEPSEDELRCTLDEASRKFPAFVGKSDFIGRIDADVDTDRKNGGGLCRVLLSEQAMVANKLFPGSIVSVSLATIRKGVADSFPLSSLADECAAHFGIECRDETANEAGNCFAIAIVSPSSKVLKSAVRLSSSLSYTMGCPTPGRTVFIHSIQSQCLNDVLNGTGRSSSAESDHIYQCKDLYLELVPSSKVRAKGKVLSYMNISGENTLEQTENGIESSPKTPLSQISTSITSRLTSLQDEEPASNLKNPNSSSIDSFNNINEVLGDEWAREFLQIRAASWLHSRCLLRGNLVAIPILSDLCIFYVKGAEKLVYNSTDKDLVNGGTQNPGLGEFINSAFVINKYNETKVYMSLSSNSASETQQAPGAPSTESEYKDVKDSLGTVPAKLGGLSKEYEILKDIISASLKDTLSSFGLRSTKGVLLHGPPGTGKTSLAQLCAYDSGVNLLCVNGPEIISQYYGESEQALHQVFESAGQSTPAVVFIDELDAIAPSRKDGGEELSQRMVATLLNLMDGISRSDGLLVIAATNRPDCIEPALRRPGRFDREIELGVPSPQQRLEILQTLICEMEHSLSDIQVQHLAMTTHGFVGADLAALCNEAAFICLKRYVKSNRYSRELCPNKLFLAFEESSNSTVEASVSPNDIEDDPRDHLDTASSPFSNSVMPSEITSPLCSKGAAKSENDGTEDDKCVLKVELEDFERARMKVRPSAMREVVLEVPKVNWEDVGGQMEVKRQLMEMVEWPQKHQEAFKRIGIRPPTGVLMFGPPGCSKTLMARAVASEAGLNFLAVKGPELFSKWVGESEKAVKSLFAKARANAPAIIFFDEIDGLAIVRGKDSDGVSVADRVMSQLLVELDGLHQRVDVTVIAATNRPDKIDSALLRPGRFDRLLYVGPPNVTDREDIFRIHLRKIPCSSNVDVKEIARITEGVTGADISLICREAALAALQESLDASEITMEHLKTATSRVEPSDSHSYVELSAKFQRLVNSGAMDDKLIQ